MNRVLKKRISRDVKENVWRWLALFLMIAMGMYIVVAVVGGAENIITGSHEAAEKNCVENGEFSVIVPLTEEQEKALRDMGITLERKFSTDIKQEDGSVLRLMKNREEINLVTLEVGRLAEKNGEIVLEKRYCEEHSYFIGDIIHIADRDFELVGIGTTPDYDMPISSFSDMSVESVLFGTAFVSSEQYADILEDGAQRVEDCTYAYRLGNGVTDREVKQMVKDFDISNLIAFVIADENPRILAAAGDMVMNKMVGLFAGVVVIALFSYVISVFIIHQINRESSVIGALYALGAKKKNLLLHYITLPTAVTFLGGLVGAALGFSKLGTEFQAADAYAYYSIPVFDVVYPIYLIVYAVIMPPLISVIMNSLVINKRLSQTALSLIRNEQKPSKLRSVELKGNNFVRNFRIRQTFRELRTSAAVIVGMFISLLIFMLSMNCLILCQNVRIDSENSTKFEYMYTLKYPEKTIPDGGEPCYAKSLSIWELGYTLDVSLIGVDSDNKYFDAKPSGGKDSVIIGYSTATKYGMKKGDKLILTDSVNEKDYEFTVEDICSYSVGLAAFIDIDDMRELFGKEDDYYNMLLSDKVLDIDKGRVYSTTSRFDVQRSSAVFTELMLPMVIMLMSVSVVIFFAVMYLMMGVMIERSSFGMSLIKIFGFRTKEVRSLYLNGNTAVVAFGAAVCIPLSKASMDAIYPWVVANVACGLNIRFEWYIYLLVFMGVMLIYFIVNSLLVHKINKITPAEVLKNRE